MSACHEASSRSPDRASARVDRDFDVRQRRDGKGSALVDVMDPSAMRSYGELCGWAPARAQAGDAIAIAAYLGGGDAVDRAMVPVAARDADQNELDHQALSRAAERGRVSVTQGCDARERSRHPPPRTPLAGT